MPLESVSSAPDSTCSSACDGRYGAQQRERIIQTLHCRFFSFEFDEWPWGGYENKDDRIILTRLWKDYPLATALAKTRLNILKWKWHLRRAERKAAGALCWNQRQCKDWGWWKKDVAHTLPVKTTGCFRDPRMHCKNWKLIACLREVLLLYLTVLLKIQWDETVVLNSTIGMYIWTWQRYGSYIICIIKNLFHL